MLGLHLKREVTVGEILTSLTILISLVAVSINWVADRKKERKGQADQIRVAASESWDKLDRWREISSSYQDFEPIFEDTSDVLKKTKDVIAARDFLRKSLTNVRAKNDRLILEERLEEASAKLYGYNPEMYRVFSCTLKQLKEAREKAFNGLLDNTQDIILHVDRGDWDNTAVVTNRFREALFDYRQTLQNSLGAPLEQTRAPLFQVIGLSDDEILNGNVKTIIHTACN